MTDLLQLAERCEQAVPDDTLDYAIAEAVAQSGGGCIIADYTTSLDAAMTLVPKDVWLELKGPRRYLNIPSPVPNYWSAWLSGYGHEQDVMGWGATPALALCAAALKARAAQEQQP